MSKRDDDVLRGAWGGIRPAGECPPARQLVAFVESNLADELRLEVEAHVSHCAWCKGAVYRMRTGRAGKTAPARVGWFAAGSVVAALALWTISWLGTAWPSAVVEPSVVELAQDIVKLSSTRQAGVELPRLQIGKRYLLRGFLARKSGERYEASVSGGERGIRVPLSYLDESGNFVVMYGEFEPQSEGRSGQRRLVVSSQGGNESFEFFFEMVR